MSRLGREFQRILSATSIANVGDGIRLAAVPLLAATWTSDPVAIAGATFVSGLPWLVFGLVSGAVVDRSDRRRLMIAVNLFRALLLGVFVALIAAGIDSIVSLYVLAFLLGSAETISDTASQAITPMVVPRDELELANGRLLAVETLANEFIGPPVGAALFAGAIALPFAVDSAAFAIAALALLGLRGSFRVENEVRLPLIPEIRAGLRWLRGSRVLRSIAVVTLVWALIDAAWFSILVLYALRWLEVAEPVFGLLLAAGGCGAVVASIAAPRLVRRTGRAAALVGSLVVAAVMQLALALTTSAAIAGIVLALSSASFVVWNVVSLSVRQAVVPNQLLGRVGSVFRLAGLGGEAIGALGGGMLAATLGVRSPMLVGAPVLLAAAAVSSRVIDRDAVR